MTRAHDKKYYARNGYPENWPEISARIRFERAGGRCECRGECGEPHSDGKKRIGSRSRARCNARHGSAHPITGSLVTLQTAHLNHTPADCSDANLKAFCERCHFGYDRSHARKVQLYRKRAGLAYRDLFNDLE